MSDIEDQFANILQNTINDEAFDDARCAALTNKGWTLVRLGTVNLDDIGLWMQENIQGDWRAYSTRWVFESADDALLFTMRFG